MEHHYGDCKNEDLHNFGLIQPYGALLAFSTTNHTVEFCSANAAEILGKPVEEMLGVQGSDLFPDGAWQDLVKLCSENGIRRLPAGLFPHALDIAAHCEGTHLLFEFEVVTENTNHWWSYAERVSFLARLERTRTLLDCRRLIVRMLFEKTGFDRVMLYRFYADMHGQVVEERTKPGVDSFLGLHFPADDIPPNALRFYTRNWQRIITDVDAENVPLIGKRNADPKSVDLTSSMLRAVHPVHVQYLKNMRVTASFSVSLLVKGKLYALVACHHEAARMLGLHDRLAFEEIARMVSLHLENLLELREKDMRATLSQQLIDFNSALVSGAAEGGIGIARHMGLMQELASANAAWFSYNGDDYFSGPLPQRGELERLRSWFESLDPNSVSSFTRLPGDLASEPGISTHACGILFLPLGENKFLALLRPELVQTVKWAGEPPEDQQPALTPRSSFAEWVAESRGTAEAWTDIQLEYTEKLRQNLLKFIKTA